MPYVNAMKTITLTVTIQEEDAALLTALGEMHWKDITEKEMQVYRTLGWKLARAVLYAYEKENE